MKKSGTLNSEATGEFIYMWIIGAIRAGVLRWTAQFHTSCCRFNIFAHIKTYSTFKYEHREGKVWQIRRVERERKYSMVRNVERWKKWWLRKCQCDGKKVICNRLHRKEALDKFHLMWRCSSELVNNFQSRVSETMEFQRMQFIYTNLRKQRNGARIRIWQITELWRLTSTFNYCNLFAQQQIIEMCKIFTQTLTYLHTQTWIKYAYARETGTRFYFTNYFTTNMLCNMPISFNFTKNSESLAFKCYFYCFWIHVG